MRGGEHAVRNDRAHDGGITPKRREEVPCMVRSSVPGAYGKSGVGKAPDGRVEE